MIGSRKPASTTALPSLAAALVVAFFAGAASADCIRTIVAGYGHSLALKTDGTVWAWGAKGYAGLGNGDPGPPEETTSPIDVSGLSGVLGIGAGVHASYAIGADRTLWAWGWNERGQLGDGTKVDAGVPVRVLSVTGAVAVSGGDEHALALLADGTVQAWGANDAGQLGDGSTTDRPAPVAIAGLSGVVAISAAKTHSLAVKDDGTVWAWGSNEVGELGNGTAGSGNQSSVPLQVSGLADVIEIAGGYETSLALRRDGTLWTWGSNTLGELGNGTRVPYSTLPVQVTSLGPVRTLGTASLSDHCARAVLEDDSVWTWGSALCLGNGSTANAFVPVRVTGLGDVLAVTGGHLHTIVTLRDGTFWSWGYNLLGQLGDGTTRDSLVPVPLPAGVFQSDAPAGDQGNVLRAARADDDVLLRFGGAPATRLRLYRDTDPLALGSTPLVDPTSISFLDLGAIASPRPLALYRLKGLSSCSLTPGP